MMRKLQFKNLNLMTLKYPLTAITSLLHRISGLFVFLCIPFLLWLLDVSVSTSEGFNYMQSIFAYPLTKIILWMFLTAFGYHLVAGIRHLVMDMGYGEALRNARMSARIIIGITVVWSILIGIWLW